MTRILQISDLHIMPEGRLFQDIIDTAAALRDMLSGLAGLLPVIGPVERQVISGELTETGCTRAYERLRALMADPPKDRKSPRGPDSAGAYQDGQHRSPHRPRA